MTDPFEVLADDGQPEAPSAGFAARLRRDIEVRLGVPAIVVTRDAAASVPTPTRSSAMTQTVIPYLAVSDAAGALDFYARAFGGQEVMRLAMGDDKRIGHSEFRIGATSFYVSDGFPEMGVMSPEDLGGTAVSLHLTVDDVDATFAAAVEAGATSLMEPEDQPHGARHGTLSDPYGHRWMISQQLEQLTPAEVAARLEGAGEVTLGPGAEALQQGPGGIWAALNYADARAGIRFMVDVLGFEEVLVVPGEVEGDVAHSQFHWPEGGVVQASSANRPDNIYSQQPTGAENLYVVTADPGAVYERCVAAGAEIVRAPEHPDYDPSGGMTFSTRDPEGNLWTFGTYAGEA